MEVKMVKKRFNDDFKEKIFLYVFFLLFSGVFFIGGLVSICQYHNLIHGMVLTEATIFDIDLNVSSRSSRQDIYITYDIDGITYNREYESDGVFLSGTAGFRAHYSVGDTLEIYYDPNNPEIIAAPRSSTIIFCFLIIGMFGFLGILYALVSLFKNYRNFQITNEEYEKEKEELRKIRKLNNQVGKKFQSMERKKKIYNQLTHRNRFKMD